MHEQSTMQNDSSDRWGHDKKASQGRGWPGWERNKHRIAHINYEKRSLHVVYFCKIITCTANPRTAVISLASSVSFEIIRSGGQCRHPSLSGPSPMVKLATLETSVLQKPSDHLLFSSIIMKYGTACRHLAQRNFYIRPAGIPSQGNTVISIH